ncbi:anthranilate phosphoribosyltransferase [Effusibacillus consociatus]|uniref:Anthranilate phosphoribosyltransferase n=1 Tax=Effusibacillus consociatus TaxID=1117041 RepID=A0ABV9Q089_9BACL
MQQFLKEVGRGKKGAKDLPFELAKEAADRIFDGEATDAQIGAFFIAERVKSETVEELLAFIESGRERAQKVTHGQKGLLDCAGPYDGRAKSFAATIPVAAVLAAAGVPVVLHGSLSLPPKFGVSLREILQQVGVPVEAHAEQIGNMIDRNNIAFIETENYCPPLRQLRKIREDLGVRTLLNTVEKFLNVAAAEYLVAGVFHTSALEKAAELTITLGYRKAMVVQGIDGSEDIPTNRPSALYIIQDGTMEKHLVNPKDYGLAEDAAPVKLTTADQASHVLEVLQGGRQYRNMVLLNSALRLWLTGHAGDISEGIEIAGSVLDSGKAWAKFSEWRGE